MALVRYTSKTSLFFSFFGGLIQAVIFIILLMLFSSLSGLIFHEGDGIWKVIIAIGTLFISFLGSILIVKYWVSRTLATISTFVYVRCFLKTQISFNEAERISVLFLPNKSGIWYPMDELTKLPKNQRRQYLFEVAFRVAGVTVLKE